MSETPVKKKTRLRGGKRRPVAGRADILDVARAIGMRDGWSAVTIRAVANELGYSSPLLYEHFRDKGHLLTEIAVDGMNLLHARLAEGLPPTSRAAVVVMIERYWTFVIENTQLYRLMNGMDGSLIDNVEVGRSAQSLCMFLATAVLPLLGRGATEAEAMVLTYELWALLHGMAALYLDRSIPFDMESVVSAGLRLIAGAPERTS
jgi:AcrR family transcriptional regulator